MLKQLEKQFGLQLRTDHVQLELLTFALRTVLKLLRHVSL